MVGEGMTATPNFASDALTGAEAMGATAPAAGAGPFVLHLCSSTTPLALAQTDLPELKRFTFFVSRRFEEGRERFRLHMGYFATLAEAEEWLSLVREIYPGAWAGEAPGRKLRERAAAAAAAQAQHAAGPQRQVAPGMRPGTAARPPAPSPVPAAAAAARAAAQPPALRVPVVHAAPPAAQRFPSVAAPVARPAARQPGAPAAPAASRAQPVAVRPAARPQTPPVAATRTAAAPAQRSAPPRPAPPRPSPPPQSRPQPQQSRPQPQQPGAAAAASRTAQRAAPGPAGTGAARTGAKPVFEDSNVREVLKALGDASATGETRLMHAPPPTREAPAENSSLSDTQVLKLLEARRAETSQLSPPEVMDSDGGIPLLKPDDTGTRQALKEAIATNAPVSFAVQLQWSVQPVELDKVPPLAIFSAYTLYTVEGSRDGRRWYGLRLGFFSDAISAKQVAYYVRSEFASVAVVPVSPQEKGRATDQDKAAALTGPAPAPADDPADEFKLFDDDHPAAAPSALAPGFPAPAARGPAKQQPKVAVGRSVPQPNAPARARARGKVGARDQRGPQTLEETLEILGASQLTFENEGGGNVNDSGVRHLRVEVQKNSPFSKLLERLSERLKKP